MRLLRDPFGASSWWPWAISPFEAGFLGAYSLAEASAILVFLFETRWAPGRLVVPSWFTFTALVGLLSLFNLNLFELQQPEDQIWFAMYLSTPLVAAYFLWWGRGRPPADPSRLTAGWRHYLGFQGLAMALIGTALIIAPPALTPCWPWGQEPFTAQVIGVIFLTSAVGAYLLWQATAPVEGLAYALPQGILGLGAVVAVLSVSTELPGILSCTRWEVLWLSALTFYGAAGVLLTWKTAFRV